jgi:UDP-2-acetamido-3-amino-2,3-dideoxy-glucuronate N-acetyltransferase
MPEAQLTGTASYPGIAVIGSGYWGKNLVRNYYNIGALKLICDKNEATLAAFREQYPKVKTCMALSDVMANKDILGVVIATPAETHHDIAREALLSGKHVYVEKPLVLDEKQGQELIALAKEKHLVLMVGHLLQYHPVFVRLKELARAGALGRINYIYSNLLNLGKIRREENILWSFAPHDISMILSLADETPENISATGGYYLHKKIADVTTTHLEFPSGLQAHVFVSWLHPFKEQKLVVVGDKKMAVFDDTLPWEDKLLLYGHQINWENNQPVPVKAEPERVDIPKDEPLKRECLHFLDCMKTGQRPVTDGDEGLRVLQVLHAAQRSLSSGGCKLPLQPSSPPARRNPHMRPSLSTRPLLLIKTLKSASTPKSGISHTSWPDRKSVKTAISARMSLSVRMYPSEKTAKSRTMCPYIKASPWKTAFSAARPWCSPIFTTLAPRSARWIRCGPPWSSVALL